MSVLSQACRGLGSGAVPVPAPAHPLCVPGLQILQKTRAHPTKEDSNGALLQPEQPFCNTSTAKVQALALHLLHKCNLFKLSGRGGSLRVGPWGRRGEGPALCPCSPLNPLLATDQTHPMAPSPSPCPPQTTRNTPEPLNNALFSICQHSGTQSREETKSTIPSEGTLCPLHSLL